MRTLARAGVVEMLMFSLTRLWRGMCSRQRVRDIREFVCWQLAHELKCHILDWTSEPPVSNHFKFCDQIRESSASATANMEEGFRYSEPAQFARFLGYAVGSLGETRDRLLDGLDRKLIGASLHSQLHNLAGAARRATNNLKRSKEREAEERRRHRRRPLK